MTTVADLLLARAEDERIGLRFEDSSWTWAEHVRMSLRRAAFLHSMRKPGVPFHFGVLLDNVPEFSFLLGAAALSGAVLVGLNPTRRGAALSRDIQLADCQFVVTEDRYAGMVAGFPTLNVDSVQWPHVEADPIKALPEDLLMLIFTSGTGGDPKAVRCTHEKVAFPGRMLADRFGMSAVDTVYVSMPMFHSNAVMAGWSVGLAAGATIALRRRFSASGFIPDVRKFGATFANYVGKPLSYVLATPPQSDDAENPLLIAYGNEGAERDLARFASRFDCLVVDGFGSTEGGIAIQRTQDTPPGALGRLADGVAVLDPDTGKPCPPGQVGEFVNTTGSGAFAGYYGDPEADSQRMPDGRYWSGDLGYVDENGYCYFAGRSSDWLRVDGENLGTAPIERILLRHPDFAEVAVYAVPDPLVGDQVMAAVVLRPGREFDVDEFTEFLAAQSDLGPKQMPRFVRIAAQLPKTATFKVLKRVLAAEGTNCHDRVSTLPVPRVDPSGRGPDGRAG